MNSSLHREKKSPLFGGLVHDPAADRKRVAIEILPTLRGALSSNRRVVAHYSDDEDALAFAGSEWAKELVPSARAVQITSCERASARCLCRGTGGGKRECTKEKNSGTGRDLPQGLQKLLR